MKRKLVSMTILVLLLIALSASSNTHRVKADGAIHIMGDGSVSPPNVAISTYDNLTYVLIGDLYAGIVAERDNIVFEGAGHVIQGTDAYGTDGFFLDGRNNVTIENVQISDFWQGINVVGSTNINISRNNVTYHYDGVEIASSVNVTIDKNVIAENYDDAVWLEDSVNASISGNQISGSALTTHDYCITLFNCSGSGIFGNNMANAEYGVGLEYSSNNTVAANGITSIDQQAIWLLDSSKNTLRENHIANNQEGICLLSGSSNNFVYHNNFVNNTIQVHTENSVNVWDDNYPSGGNYWSDYSGSDSSKGQGQNETGSDGIGDRPYPIDQNNTDRFPLMVPHAVPEFSSTVGVISLMLATLGLIFLKRKCRG